MLPPEKAGCAEKNAREAVRAMVLIRVFSHFPIPSDLKMFLVLTKGRPLN